MTEPRTHLNEIIDDFQNAMLVTLHADGRPHARPMHVAEHTDDGALWFVTGRDGVICDEVHADGRAAVAFQSRTRYASLRGTAACIEDEDHLLRVWNDTFDVWFANGPDDAVLVRFIAEEGEYWDAAGTRGLKYVIDVVKAAWTGEVPATGEEHHARVPNV